MNQVGETITDYVKVYLETFNKNNDDMNFETMRIKAYKNTQRI